MRLAMRRDPDFQLAHRHNCVRFIALSAEVLLSVPDIMLFLERLAGYMVLAALLRIAMTEPD